MCIQSYNQSGLLLSALQPWHYCCEAALQPGITADSLTTVGLLLYGNQSGLLLTALQPVGIIAE